MKIEIEMNKLPSELIINIFEFYNPNQNKYQTVINHINSKNRYSSCVRQLKQYCVYNRNGDVIEFCKYAILNEVL